VKHAGKETLASLAPLLEELRAIPGLVEKSTGVFYLHSRAFLHFHEDPAGIFADARLDGVDFERVEVTPRGQGAFVAKVAAAAKAASKGKGSR
jgi:hypothetical protein